MPALCRSRRWFFPRAAFEDSIAKRDPADAFGCSSHTLTPALGECIDHLADHSLARRAFGRLSETKQMKSHVGDATPWPRCPRSEEASLSR